MTKLLHNYLRGPAGIKEVWHIALPVFLSQAVDTIMMFTDRYFLAELGQASLAASMGAGLSVFLVAMFLLGTLGQVTAFVAQYYGAREKKKCAQVVDQGLLISILLSAPIVMFAFYFAESGFRLAGHEGDLLKAELQYFDLMVFTVFTVAIRTTFVGFFTGLGQTRIVLWVNSLGVLFNIPLSYALIFGKWGFPQMGIEGAALATLLAGLLPIFIFLMIYYSKKYQEDYSTRHLPKFDREVFKRVLKFGVPSGIEMFVNMAAFTTFMLVVQSLSNDAAAAITIVLNWDIVAALPLYGLGQGAMSLVGKYMGAKKPRLARRAGRSAIQVALIYSTCITIVYLVFTEVLTGMFHSNMENVDYNQVYYLANIMLRLSCVYITFDAFFIIFSAVVRGAGDTRWAMIFSNTLEWIFTITTVYAIRQGYLDAITSWMALIVLVMALGIGFFLRYLSSRWQNIEMIA